MKKNKMMRAASGLLVATLLTTSIISGTFAKYTTQDSASDTARVAKWGVKLQVAGALYEGAYATGSTAPVTWADSNAASVSVHADANEDVVAPGTEGNTGLTFSVNGTPEVSGTITTKVEYENIYLKKGKYGVMVKLGKISEAEYATIMAETEDTDKLYTYDGTKYTLATSYSDVDYYTLEDYVDLNENYYPVEYQMTGTTTNYNVGYSIATTTDTLDGIVNAMATNLGTPSIPSVVDGKTTVTYTKAFTPNQNLANDVLKLENQNITWKWDLDQTSADPEGNDACMYCKADTILGNLKAGTSVVKLSGTDWVAPTADSNSELNDYNLETEFGLDITVTQDN